MKEAVVPLVPTVVEEGRVVRATPAPRSGPQYLYVVEEDGSYNRRKLLLYSVSCACCCLLFFLLFFLIPRRPRVTYENVVLYFEPNTPIQVVQTYQVYNPNFYSIYLQNFDQLSLTSQEMYYLGVDYQFTATGQLQGSPYETILIFNKLIFSTFNRRQPSQRWIFKNHVF
jgi:hypothetical protein